MSSVFDIIGPIMIGPSSSHTAGAARLGKMARCIFDEPVERVTMTLYGSFAKTYKGHGTDRALIAGLLGFGAEDVRIRQAFKEADEAGLQYEFVESAEPSDHPNVVRFDLYGHSGRHMSVLGRSLGGGRILITRIDGLEVEITGDEHTIMTFHTDKPGVIAAVTTALSLQAINISSMRVFRKEKHSQAVMLIHTDSEVSHDVLDSINAVSGIESVMYFKPL